LGNQHASFVVLQVGNDLTVSKWWQWVYYPFKYYWALHHPAQLWKTNFWAETLIRYWLTSLW